MVNIFIGNIIKDHNNPNYYQLMWRVPHKQFKDLGWICLDQKDIPDPDLMLYLIHVFPGIEYILFWNTTSLFNKNYGKIKYAKENNGIKVIYYIDDLHQKGGTTRKIKLRVMNIADIIISTYQYTFNKFFPEIDNDKAIWFPHSHNEIFNIKYNNNPINKITLTGNLDNNIYPYRNKFLEYSKKYKIKILKHHGYSVQKHDIIGQKYIKYLNKYIASFTCYSKEETPYVMSKIFEIPASGCLLILYDGKIIQQLLELGFKNKENYISVNDDNMEDIIKYVLDMRNRKEIDKIRKKGYDLVWSKHLLKHRCEELNKLL